MRPYLAVIHDSLREAIASRVLWIVLLMITLFLIGIAPLGISQQLSSTLHWSDIYDPPQLIVRLHEEFTSDNRSPGRRIWELLDPRTQSRLKRATQRAAEDPTNLIKDGRLLRDELNEMLSRRDFYDPQSWRDVQLDAETAQWLQQPVDQLSEIEVRRRNRLLLENAYRGIVAVSPPTSVQFHYATLEVAEPLPIGEESLAPLIRGVLAACMDFFIGVVAMFVALLVTAPIIPHTFESGSVELLLSKPVSRVLLFLAKFAGGCCFILFCGTYLIGGFWLIAGLRLGVWDARFLWCIPIFGFLFVIYYSVSALAGLVWRSPIVAVIVTLLFWGLCFSVGSTKAFVETIFLRPHRIVKLVPAGDQLLAVSEDGTVSQWDDDQRLWKAVFVSPEPALNFRRLFGGGRQRQLGPVYDPQRQQIVAAALPRKGIQTASSASLDAGQAAEGWDRRPVAEVPGGTIALFIDPQGDAVTVARNGIYRLPAGEIRPEQRRPDDQLFFDLPEFRRAEVPRTTLSVSNLRQLAAALTGRGTSENSERAPPSEAVWNPQAAAMDSASGRIVVCSPDHVVLHEPDPQGVYHRGGQWPLQTDGQPLAVAFAGDTVLVARADGTLVVQSTADDRASEAFRPEGGNTPRTVACDPQGRWFAMLLHNGRLWLFDSQQQRLFRPRVTGQGDLSAVALTDDGNLLVADRDTRFSRYQLPGLELRQRGQAAMDLLDITYRYGILPLYTVFPKPGELDITVQYLLTQQDTQGHDLTTEDLDAPQRRLDPWAPVVSSLAFVCVMLTISCWYMHRTEF